MKRVTNLIAAVLAIHSMGAYSSEPESVTCMHNGKAVQAGETVKFIPDAQRIHIPKDLPSSAYEVLECSEYKLSPSANDTFVAGVWVRRQSAK
jgi:hypothetical protein